MNSKDMTFLVRSALALFFAIQIWVWLTFVGAMWLTSYEDAMAFLFVTLVPLKKSLATMLFFGAPMLVLSFFLHRRLPDQGRTIIYLLLGAMASTLYLAFLGGFDLVFIKHYVALYIAAGCVAGVTYSAIVDMPLGSRSGTGETDDVSNGRRNLLGSLAFMTGGVGFLGVMAGPFHFWLNRNSYLDVNVAHLEDGQMMTVEFANTPIWILKRTPDVIRLLERDDDRLLDPQSVDSQQPEPARNALRSIRPEYFVVEGLCTHLGCMPDYKPDGRKEDWPNAITGPQFFCPCHAGVFDLAGRVYSGMPPPRNLVVPNHEFVSDHVVRLHFPSVV